jgi:hypothetical protein
MNHPTPIKLTHFDTMLSDFMKRHRINDIVKDFDFKHEAKVYLGSGQMFNEFGRLGLEILADLCEAVNLDYYLPQHNGEINDKDAEHLITNEMITEGDNDQLEQCNIMFSHFTIPEDSGLSAECGRFGYMRKAQPHKYYANVAILDDIRSMTIPTPVQKGKDNQTIYMNSYTAGIPDYYGNNLYECFKFMYESYKRNQV